MEFYKKDENDLKKFSLRKININGSELLEYYGFLENENKRLFTTIYESSIKTKKYIIIVPPLFIEKERSLFFITKLSRKLALEGYSVINFDFWGSGNSTGNNEDITFETLKSDLECIINWSKRTYEYYELDAVIGLHFGADFLKQYDCISNLCKLIFIHPVIDISKYFKRNYIIKYILFEEIKFKRKLAFSHFMSSLKSEKYISLLNFRFNTIFVEQLINYIPLNNNSLNKKFVILKNSKDKFPLNNKTEHLYLNFSNDIAWIDEDITKEIQAFKNIQSEVVNFIKKDQ